MRTWRLRCADAERPKDRPDRRGSHAKRLRYATDRRRGAGCPARGDAADRLSAGSYRLGSFGHDAIVDPSAAAIEHALGHGGVRRPCASRGCDLASWLRRADRDRTGVQRLEQVLRERAKGVRLVFGIVHDLQQRSSASTLADGRSPSSTSESAPIRLAIRRTSGSIPTTATRTWPRATTAAVVLPPTAGPGEWEKLQRRTTTDSATIQLRSAASASESGRSEPLPVPRARDAALPDRFRSRA